MSYWIVIVDDDAASLKSARILLGESGMKVSCLRSGADLLRFMIKNKPDLILLDIMMPDMDGFASLSALRKQAEETGKTVPPVIFITGDKDSETERRGLTEGASDYIHKPFDEDILVGRISRTIENSKLIESLTEGATLDKLTGFLNKASGTEKVTSMCQRRSGALAILDLDCFKLVNDIYGHDMGDKVLKAFAEILRQNTRSEDVISRVGGDEFLAFFNDMTQELSVSAISGRLNEQLMEKCLELMGEDFDIPIGISSGVVFVPEFGTDFDRLFSLADSALYRVKRNGKHGYVIYSDEPSDVDVENDLDNEMARISQLVEERGVQKGALLLDQDAFAFNYRFIIRFIKRYNGKAIKLLFSLNTDREGRFINDAASAFADVLKKTLRKSDIMMQNRTNRFFLLLPGITAQADVDIITDRILREWERSDFRDEVEVRFVTEFLSY